MKIKTPILMVNFILPLSVLAEIPSESSVKLEDIAITEQVSKTRQVLQVSESYESFDPIDSGLSVISEQSVAISQQGDIDTTELLNVLPFVQMDATRYDGDAQSEQALRPSDFSISGGSYYDNNIMIDGVSVNSVLDVTQSKYNENYDEVNGQTTQTLYVDPSLLQAVEVLDSNVTAQYGDFSGGVVDYQVREAKDEFSMRISTGFQFDEMVNYLGQNVSGDPKPDFIKYRTSISADLPLTEKLKVLVSYSRAESASYYTKDEKYDYQEYTNGDTSQNFLFKSIYEFNEQLRLTASWLYSPYESEYTADDDFASERLSLSSGMATYLQLTGYHGGYDWSSKLSYSQSDTSRDWDGDRYKWDGDSEYGSSLCDDSYCTEGGFGDIGQTQQDYTLKLTASRELAQGVLSFGSDVSYTHAYKERLEDSWYYRLSTVDENGGIICDDGDQTCMNDTAFTEGVLYTAYEVDVGVYQQTLWSEYEWDFGPVNFRMGLRYDYDNFMENHNVSPRMTSSWEVMPDYFISFGAGRYYTSNLLAYAIKAATPATTTYTQEVNDDGTLTDWALAATSTAYDYSQGNLTTPYSDELTLALTLPTSFDGRFRIKGVQRWNRDKFSTDREYNEDSDLDYTLSNDGKSDYRGLSLEWSGRVWGHTFSANSTWSKTTTFAGASDYFSETDIEDLESSYLYYDGAVISEYELYNIEEQENYASPFRAHLGWSRAWLNKKLLTKLSVDYSGAYTRINDTDDNIEIEGEDYDIYAEESINAYTDVSLNAQMQVYRTMNTSTIVDMRITNLFNDNPYSDSSTYQRGRAVWLGVSMNIR